MRGWPSLARRGACLWAKTTGNLNALKSCSVPGRIRPGPPHARGFRAKPSWRHGLLLRGRLAPPSPCCLARQDGRAGGQAGGQEMSLPGVEVDTGLLGNVPLPSLRSLPRGCPAQHPSWGVAETGAMGGEHCAGSVFGSCCWEHPGRGQRGGASGRWEASTGPAAAAAAACRR